MTLALAVENDDLVVEVPEHPPVRLPLTGRDRVGTLLVFGYPGRKRTRYGLAVLDESGLVMMEAPGSRSRREVEAFAREHGLGFELRRFETGEEARIALARRSPGWHVVTWGRPPSPLPRLRVPGVRSLWPPVGSPKIWWREQLLYVLMWLVLAYGVTFAVLVVLTMTDPGRGVTRGLELLGIAALALAAVTVAGAAVVVGTDRRRTRRQIADTRVLRRRGAPRCRLVVVHDRLLLETERRTREIDASRLTLYSVESGVGGLIAGEELLHLPGHWDPEEVERFAVRNGLDLRIRTLSREEYLDLTEQVRDAVP
ncbi:hypothetical protein OHA77_17805 [Streptosporangium sp. NBC_01639]|uniref:hypothetical protein n=1 Tax=unclassified Streptosporangium TaxID=2632669 RepID=UPI002DD7B716|nr:hypothetical protein [Streptosporangium sp. NBC_01756]WSC83145.1 hypothetical protein OIE48_22245 [Streptosporangium sp. NBC_01756]WTD58306.1 hypothetical protein OHA77_17805 [Streptosporangium sp. NBC_01639]